MKRLLAALLALMMLLTMTSCAAPDAAETDDKLTLVAFNVGKADALLLTSGDTAYLIDTGTEDSWADLSRALEALGVTHLTGVIVTHMDKDHYGGAKQLAESDIAIDGWYASWAWEKEKWKKHPVVKAAAVRGEEITCLRSFVYTMIRNQSLNLIRNRKRSSQHFHLLPEEEENNFFNILVEEESNRLLFNAINTLAPQSAAIIQLSLQGLKNEEIARELSISENTVKVLKYRSLKKLRQLLHHRIFNILAFYI